MSDFVVWKNVSVPNACVLTEFVGIDNTYPLMAGVPLEAEFPEDAHFQMSPDDPNDTLLTDSIRNTDSVIVGSTELSSFIRDAGAKHVEYLPVAVHDHKGRTVDRQYVIIHPVRPVDCLDRDASDVKYSMILKTRIDSIGQLVIDEDKIPEDRLILRCQDFNDVTLVRRHLAEAIDKESFTGIGWLELNDYRWSPGQW